MAHFDLSDPKIVAGLLIGGALPYLIPAIPATLTKWLLFGSVLRNVARPRVTRLCVAAAAEPICLGVAASITGWLAWQNVSVLVTVCSVYSVLAMFANLPLFPSVNRHDSASLVKRASYAFAVGLIYLCYAIPLAYLFSYLVTRSNP